MQSGRRNDLNHLISEKEKIFVFGTGNNAIKLHKVFTDRGEEIKICAYVDNNPDRWENIFFEKPVISAEKLVQEMNGQDLLILSMEAYEEVENQMIQLGVTQKNIMTIHTYLDMCAEEKIAEVRERKQKRDVIKVGFITQEIQSWDKTAPVYEAMRKRITSNRCYL